jgi:galactose-1-phosphate uridylyltransferase
MLEEELRVKSRIVLVSEHLVALEPFTSPTPFCTHMHPKRHMGRATEMRLVIWRAFWRKYRAGCLLA